MRRFADIHGALDYAVKNQATLKFPFTCKCNRMVLRVLSPQLARSLHRNGPSLIVSRTLSRVLELGYVMSVNALEDLLRSVSNAEGHYRLVCSDDHVTVVCCNGGTVTAEFSFPLARRMPGAAAEQGDFVLMTVRPQTSQLRLLWLPLESRLLHSSIAAA